MLVIVYWGLSVVLRLSIGVPVVSSTSTAAVGNNTNTITPPHNLLFEDDEEQYEGDGGGAVYVVVVNQDVFHPSETTESDIRQEIQQVFFPEEDFPLLILRRVIRGYHSLHLRFGSMGMNHSRVKMIGRDQQRYYLSMTDARHGDGNG